MEYNIKIVIKKHIVQWRRILRSFENTVEKYVQHENMCDLLLPRPWKVLKWLME